MTKKILAGILAAASILSLSVTASAAVASPYAPDGDSVTTDVSAPGATTYKVDVGQLQCVMDVVVPTTIKAFLNPYNSEIQITDTSAAPQAADKITTGVTSYAYLVENKSTTVAVGIDIIGGVASGKGDVEILTAADAKKLATAIAMTESTDAEKKAKATELAKYAGKKAYAVLVAGASSTSDVTAGSAGYANTEQAAAATAAKAATVVASFVEEDKSATSTANGVFVFTEDEKSLENFIKLPVVSSAGKERVAAFTFAGLCQNNKSASGEKEDWTAKDGLSLNFALKVHP